MATFCITFVCFAVLGGCESRISPIKEKIAVLQSCPMQLPLDSMRCIRTVETDTMVSRSRLQGMKLVVYTDAADCSSCVLKKMYQWNGLLKKMEVYGTHFQPYFIFSPSPKDMGVFYMAMKQFSPSSPVYLDSLGVFERVNSQMPPGSELHTFLLDENNNVPLVGNPIWNEKTK